MIISSRPSLTLSFEVQGHTWKQSPGSSVEVNSAATPVGRLLLFAIKVFAFEVK